MSVHYLPALPYTLLWWIIWILDVDTSKRGNVQIHNSEVHNLSCLVNFAILRKYK